MERDRAGNFLKKAKNLGTLTSTLKTSKDFVGKADLDDLYQLRLSNRSSLNLQASNLSKGAKIKIEVFKLKGAKNKVIKAIGKVAFSTLKGKKLSQNISFVKKSAFSKSSNSLNLALDAGEYYFRIAPRKGDTAYRISASATDLSVQFNRKWIQQFGTNKNDYGYGIAPVGDNLYISGSTEGNLGAANAGDQDSFAALYTTNGTLQWQRQFGSPGYDIAADITADSSGNYYVGSSASSGPTNFNGYATKFASTGTREWQKQISPNGSAAVLSVATDGAGNASVYVAGLMKNSPLTPATAYVAKYNSAGQEIWLKEWSGTGSSNATAVAIDKDGNVYIAGITNASLQGSLLSSSFQGGDAFVAKYNANGTKLWDQTIATPAQEYARSIAVDALGNVYITGNTDGTIPGQTSAGGIDGFVAKYSTTGTQLWAKQFGTSGLDDSQGVAVSDTGYVFLTGGTTGGIFGNTNAGGSDAWLAAFNSDGKLAGSTQIGTNQDDTAYGIAAAGSSVYVLGQTQGAIAGGTNQGQYDVWVSRYDIV
ncbi:MAG TPA: SBBP repeat-containing protein [Coleofasciculaceae cyanobacterium]